MKSEFVTNILIKYKYIVMILSGLIFSVPFFLPQLWILSWVSLIPFYIVIFTMMRTFRLNKLVKCYIVFEMFFYLSIYIWFLAMYPMDFTGLTNFQGLVVAVAAWIVFPVLQTLPMLIIPLTLYPLRKIPVHFYPLASACLYVVVEWIQSWFLTGLTWANLAISQYKNLTAIQSISIFGSYFIGFLIILVNSMIAVKIIYSASGNNISYKKGNVLLILAVMLFFADNYFGMFRIMTYKEPDNFERVSIVQGNFSVYEKWEAGSFSNTIDTYMSMISDAAESDGSWVFVCPESALPADISGTNVEALFEKFADKNNITIITGCLTSEEIDGEWMEYNSLYAFSPDVDGNKIYSKRHLVPFGEYLPMRELLIKIAPFVENIAMLEDEISPGEGSNLIYAGDLKIGGLICFDSIFPELARQSVKDGANILVVATNDAWYRESSGIYQHNAQSVLRAVENGRYVVRSANTGISSFISPLGEIIQNTKVNERTYITEDVGLCENLTLYTVFGDILIYLSFACIVLFIIKAIINKFKTNQEENQ